MKNRHFIFGTVVFAFLLSTVSFSQSAPLINNHNTYENIEENYLIGLNSDNMGLKISCAYFLGEMKSRKAVIPLMQILNSEQHEGARIIAAWSLVKIGDPIGIYLVQKLSESCDCSSVRCMCDHFYIHYLQQEKGKNSFDKFVHEIQ